MHLTCHAISDLPNDQRLNVKWQPPSVFDLWSQQCQTPGFVLSAGLSTGQKPSDDPARTTCPADAGRCLSYFVFTVMELKYGPAVIVPGQTPFMTSPVPHYSFTFKLLHMSQRIHLHFLLFHHPISPDTEKVVNTLSISGPVILLNSKKKKKKNVVTIQQHRSARLLWDKRSCFFSHALSLFFFFAHIRWPESE